MAPIQAVNGQEIQSGEQGRGGSAGSSALSFQKALQTAGGRASSAASAVSMSAFRGAEKYDSIFEEASRTYGVSKLLLLAVAKQESNFSATAVSRAGAQGVMQLMPSTARSLGVKNAFDPRENIMAGAKLLRDNIKSFGSVPLALAAYNAGPAAVKKYGGVPPYAETQNYVKKIMATLGDSAYQVKSSFRYSGTGGTGTETGGELLSGENAELLSELFRGMGMLGAGGMGAFSAAGSGIGSPLSLLLQSVLPGYAASRGAAAGDGEEEGKKIHLSKESFQNLVELLRMQMMMQAGSGIGEMAEE